MFRCSLQLLSSRLSRPSIACRLTRRLRPVSRGTHNGALDDLSDPAFFHARKAEMLRSPPLLAWDVMSPTNSNLLDILLSDFIPSACQPWQAHTRGRPASSRPDLSCRNLPLGHHLVYFPLQKPTSALMKDGTDPFPCPGHPFVQRLWAGGNIDFSRGPDEVRLDCTPAVCIETIEDVRFQQAVGKKGGVVLVDVQRLYMTEASYKASIGPQIESQPDAAFPQAPLDISGTGIRETRTLAFLQQPDADQVARATDAAPGTNSDLPGMPATLLAD